jgi:hypothetical protein
VGAFLDALEEEGLEVLVFAPGPAPPFTPIGAPDSGAGVVALIIVRGDEVADVLRYSDVAAAEVDWTTVDGTVRTSPGSSVSGMVPGAKSAHRRGNLILLASLRPPPLAEGFHASERLEAEVIRVFSSLE